MPKKNSSKALNVMKEGSDAEQLKPSKITDEINSKNKSPVQEKPEKLGHCNEKPKNTKRKKADEIDEIFASLKKRKAEKAKADKSADAKDKTRKKRSRMPKESVAFNDEPKPIRRTNDGFVIYSEEDLGFNKKDAGGTALCPFDCSCCF